MTTPGLPPPSTCRTAYELVSATGDLPMMTAMMPAAIRLSATIAIEPLSAPVKGRVDETVVPPTVVEVVEASVVFVLASVVVVLA